MPPTTSRSSQSSLGRTPPLARTPAFGEAIAPHGAASNAERGATAACKFHTNAAHAQQPALLLACAATGRMSGALRGCKVPGSPKHDNATDQPDART